MIENRRQQAAGSYSERGFTLIELAIVLVIIGIILGAVLKGQDLIENARRTKITTIPGAWEVPIWAYYDRNGYLPGANATNSAILSHTALTGAFDTAKLAYPATSVGGTTANIAAVANVCGSTNTNINVMLLTSVPLDSANLLDNRMDGALNGASGTVRYCGNAGTNANAAWPTTDPVTVTVLFDKQP